MPLSVAICSWQGYLLHQKSVTHSWIYITYWIFSDIKALPGLCSHVRNVPWNTECKRARYVAVTNKAKTGLQDFWWLRGLALACTGLNEPAAGSGPRKAYLRLSAAAEKVARRRFRSSAPAVCRPGPDEMLRLFIIGIAPRQHADIAVGERRIHPHAETIRDNFLARRRG